MKVETTKSVVDEGKLTDFDAVAFGAINIDVIFPVPSLDAWKEAFGWWPSTGEGIVAPEEFQLVLSKLQVSASAHRIYEGGGGQAANFAVAFSRSGLRTAILGAVGSDLSSTMALRELGSVDRSAIRHRGSTGKALVLVDPYGNREILVDPGVNATLEIGDLDYGVARSAKHVHCTSLPKSTHIDLQAMLFAGLSPGTTTSLDIGAIYAHEGLDRLRPILAGLSLLFVTVDELQTFTGASEEQSLDLLFAAGVRAVCCKRGPDGASLWNRDGSVAEAKAPSVKAIDTTGAGDVLAGTLIAALLQGLDQQSSLTAAVGLASQSVRGWGRSCYPTRTEFAIAIHRSSG